MAEVTLKKVAMAMSGSKVSPAGVLATYRDFICGEVPEAAEIYSKIDAKTIFPTNALNLLRPLVFAVMIKTGELKGEAKRVKAEEKAAQTEASEAEAANNAEVKREKFVASIYDAKGQVIKVWKEKKKVARFVNAEGEKDETISYERVEVELTEKFDLPQQAERWIARRLTTGAGESSAFDNDCFGEYWNPGQLDRESLPIVTIITMISARKIMNPAKPKAACHVKKPKQELTGNRIRCNNYVAKFSHG